MNEWNFLNYDSSVDKTLKNFKKAARVHKKVRTEFRKLIDSGEVKGMKYFDIANRIETLIETESKFQEKNPFKSGIGFPIGLSINECAAHWTPNPGEKRVLKDTDVVKVDYGVHYDGCIIDSAFTFSLNNKYDELMEIGKGATNLAIKNSGVDAILGEIGAETQEFIESHEVEILLNFFDNERERFQRNSKLAEEVVPASERLKDTPIADQAAWFEVANILLNLDETITKN